MIRINENYLKIQASYLFTEIAHRVKAHQDARPDARVIRLGIALLLIPRFGLEGYWIAMATELCVKGLVFAVRIGRGRWMKTLLTAPET